MINIITRSDIKEIIKVGIILCLITALSAGALAYVNHLTNPIIQKNETAKMDNAMKKVLGVGDDCTFTNVLQSPYDIVTKIYTTNGKGTVVLVEPSGYGGTINMVVGIDEENKIKAIDITSQQETPGLGSNCQNEEFKNRFIGKTDTITVVKSGAKDNEIDAITSATVTSKAVARGANAALEAVKKLEKGEIVNE